MIVAFWWQKPAELHVNIITVKFVLSRNDIEMNPKVVKVMAEGSLGSCLHKEFMTWKHFPHYWPYAWESFSSGFHSCVFSCIVRLAKKPIKILLVTGDSPHKGPVMRRCFYVLMSSCEMTKLKPGATHTWPNIESNLKFESPSFQIIQIIELFVVVASKRHPIIFP